MKILVTGANGFIGKNLVSTLHNIKDKKDTSRGNISIEEIYTYDIDNTYEELKQFTKSCDFIFHLAGVNRPKNVDEFYKGNSILIEELCSLLESWGNTCPIVVTSSIQVDRDNDYGKSKKEGEKFLIAHSKKMNSQIYIYRLSNIFGKWCKPNYNSVVATWCYNIANDREINISDENIELSLSYIDDVVDEFINKLKVDITENKQEYCRVDPIYKITLGKLANIIKEFRKSRENLSIPYMREESLEKKLYSTYLSYLPAQQFNYPLKMNIDTRGSFTEFLRIEDYGQVSINISKPGITKGQHWHHSKNEKFLVVSGRGMIQLRKVGSNEILNYYVSGEQMEVVDIPTGYTHNIINLGETDMVTIMWANEKFNPNKPDTYFEEV